MSEMRTPRRFDKKGLLAIYDAVIFFMVAGIASMVITVAVMGSSDVDEMEEARRDIDRTSTSLPVILQYSIRAVNYQNETGAKCVLEDKTILNLLDFLLTNLLQNRSYDTANIPLVINMEIARVVHGGFELRAEANNETVAVQWGARPLDCIATSVTAPGSEALGVITVSFWTWDA
jgi:hypothetical protein